MRLDVLESILFILKTTEPVISRIMQDDLQNCIFSYGLMPSRVNFLEIRMKNVTPVDDLLISKLIFLFTFIVNIYN